MRIVALALAVGTFVEIARAKLGEKRSSDVRLKRRRATANGSLRPPRERWPEAFSLRAGLQQAALEQETGIRATRGFW